MQLKLYRNKRDIQSIELYKQSKQQMFLVLDQKEIFWRQRSKQLWLHAGDRNTKYFHTACSTRRRTNQIQRLKNDDGVWLDWHDGLADFITDYYAKLFTTGGTEVEEVIDCVEGKITERHNRDLLMPITDEEVKQALFHMHPDKAPGPDGMTPAFFQRHRSVVGKDIVKLVRDFFET